MIKLEKLQERAMQTKYIEDYVAAARQQGVCMLTDSKTSNRAYDRIIKALHDIRKSPDRGEAALLPLLDHENVWVKLWASTHLLPLRTEEACAALEALAAGPDRFAGFNADMVLKEWRAGRLSGER